MATIADSQYTASQGTAEPPADEPRCCAAASCGDGGTTKDTALSRMGRMEIIADSQYTASKIAAQPPAACSEPTTATAMRSRTCEARLELSRVCAPTTNQGCVNSRLARAARRAKTSRSHRRRTMGRRHVMARPRCSDSRLALQGKRCYAAEDGRTTTDMVTSYPE